MPKAFYKFTGTGRRKTSVARVYMNQGTGRFEINKRAFEEYFPERAQQTDSLKALKLVNMEKKFDVRVNVNGGGISGQAQAINCGLAHALLTFDPELRSKLKEGGFLTRDARQKERKKYGQPGARKRFQYSKR